MMSGSLEKVAFQCPVCLACFDKRVHLLRHLDCRGYRKCGLHTTAVNWRCAVCSTMWEEVTMTQIREHVEGCGCKQAVAEVDHSLDDRSLGEGHLDGDNISLLLSRPFFVDAANHHITDDEMDAKHTYVNEKDVIMDTTRSVDTKDTVDEAEHHSPDYYDVASPLEGMTVRVEVCDDFDTLIEEDASESVENINVEDAFDTDDHQCWNVAVNISALEDEDAILFEEDVMDDTDDLLANMFEGFQFDEEYPDQNVDSNSEVSMDAEPAIEKADSLHPIPADEEAAVIIPYLDSTLNYTMDDVHAAAEESGSDIATKCDLLHFCYKSGITRRVYKDLKQLKGLRDADHAPCNMQTLERQVFHHLKQFLPIKKVSVPKRGGGKYEAAQLSFSDSVMLMICDTALREQIKENNSRCLPADLTFRDDIVDLLHQRQAHIAEGNYSFTCMGDGVAILENLLHYYEDIMPAYRIGKAEGMDMYFMHFVLYADDFTKFLNSGVSQTIYQVTLAESTLGGAITSNFATLILMLANAKGPKSDSVGDDPYLATYTEELQQLRKGVMVRLGNKNCLLFVFVLAIAGDLLALNRLCRRSGGAAKCVAPCRMCNLRNADLINSGAVETVLRPPDELHTLYRLNEELIGPAKAGISKNHHYTLGYTGCSVFARWFDVSFDFHCLLTDTMHCLHLGIDKAFFVETFKLLNRSPTGTGDKASPDEKRNWVKCSTAFTLYAKRNRLTLFTSFSDAESFEGSRMTAASRREFVLLSPHVLIHLGLPPRTPRKTGDAVAAHVHWHAQQRCFDAWCAYVKICELVHLVEFTATDLELLDSLIKLVLAYWRANMPNILTINAHGLTHLVEGIKRYGPPRYWANWHHEAYIRIVKPLYKNSNNTAMEYHIFRRYLLPVFVMHMRNIHKLYEDPDTDTWDDVIDYKRDCWPSCLAPCLLFASYTKFRLHDGNRSFVLHAGDEQYPLLSNRFYANNDRKATIGRINYAMARSGDYFLLAPTHPTSPGRIAQFITVLRDVTADHRLYVAYSFPSRQVSNNSYKYLNRVSVTYTTTKTLEACKSEHFIQLVKTYPSATNHDECLLLL